MAANTLNAIWRQYYTISCWGFQQLIKGRYNTVRMPNGYGSVVKLSGNRRRPYVVRKTTGWNEKGHPIYLTIGYYATREEGMIALAEYNKDPWDIDQNKITMAELYKKWLENSALEKLAKKSVDSMKSAYKHCSNIYNMKYRDIKAFHMQECIDNCGYGYSTQSNIKSLLSNLDKFALKLDIDVKSFSQLVTTESTPETSKKPFTDEEVRRLWEIKDEPWVDSVLVFLYSGWRISELLGLKRNNIDLGAGTMKGGVKTSAGKDRIVPIHSMIFDIVKRRYDEGGEHLFGISLTTYNKYWRTIMSKTEMKHTPHECRHTFRSKLDSAGANKVAIDRIMGHAGSDVGERVYTHKTINELKTAIELVNYN